MAVINVNVDYESEFLSCKMTIIIEKNTSSLLFELFSINENNLSTIKLTDFLIRLNEDITKSIRLMNESDDSNNPKNANCAENFVYQCTLMEIYDKFLGIIHPEVQEYSPKMKICMPQFDNNIMDKIMSISDYVLSCQDTAIVTSYNDCIKSLIKFRQLHLDFVAQSNKNDTIEFYNKIINNTKNKMIV